MARAGILLEALNRVHEFAIRHEILCPCGGHDFSAAVRGNSISLACRHCGRHSIISAENEEDLTRLETGFDIDFIAPDIPSNR